MESRFKLPSEIIDMSINSQLLAYIEMRFNRFYELNKDVIEEYFYLKEKLVELDARLNLKYTLTITNSITSGKLVNAKLKLPFAKNPNSKSKYPYFNIHVGKLTNYKRGLKDPQLKLDAEKKLREYIDKKYPFTIQTADNQQFVFLYKG
jgi:hypothetical protein